MTIKYVVMIQCEKSRRRCCGLACSESFYERNGFFEGLDYPHGTRYVAFTCGGCPGTNTAVMLANFAKRLAKLNGAAKDEIVVHLSSCMATHNFHHDRCAYIDDIKKLIADAGYANVVEGTYKSRKTQRLREEGVYRDYKKPEQ